MNQAQVLATNEVHNLIKNIDYSLRFNNIKKIGVFSDGYGEGKSTFIKVITPLLAKLYNRKIMIVDLAEANDLKKHFTNDSNENGHITTKYMNINFINKGLIDKFNSNDEIDLDSKIDSYLESAKELYDLIIINTSTLRRSHKTIIPNIAFENAIVIKSDKSLSMKNNYITNELLDRDIHILGSLYNEGV